ncbi:MAG: hypothetical protein ACKO25_00975 [Cyanobium sp.]
MGQQPVDQLLMDERLAVPRCRCGRLEQAGQQQHHDQAADQVVEAQHRMDLAADGQALLRIGHGLHQQPMQAIPARILLAAEDCGLGQGSLQRQRIEAGAGDGVGHRQQGVRGKADHNPRHPAAIELDATAGGRNKQTGGTEAVGALFDRVNVGTIWIGEHQLGIALLFHFAINRGAPGSEDREITQAKAAGMIEEGLIAMGMVPAMHNQGQIGANNTAEIVGVDAGERSPRQLDERQGRFSFRKPESHRPSFRYSNSRNPGRICQAMRQVAQSRSKNEQRLRDGSSHSLWLRSSQSCIPLP